MLPKWKQRLNIIKNYFSKDLEIEYTNTHLIDEYIDNYFFLNFSPDYSVKHIKENVFTLFHNILLAG